MKRILIVEDNVSNAEVITAIFDEEGFETKTLLVVDDLFSTISIFKPDLILMDIKLQNADGRVLCNEIKANPDMEHIFIILMTATLMHNYKNIPCEPDLLVTKPFDVYQLTDQIKALAHH